MSQDDRDTVIQALRDELARMRKDVSDIQIKVQGARLLQTGLTSLVQDALIHIEEGGGKDLRDAKFWARWIHRAAQLVSMENV